MVDVLLLGRSWGEGQGDRESGVCGCECAADERCGEGIMLRVAILVLQSTVGQVQGGGEYIRWLDRSCKGELIGLRVQWSDLLVV